MQERIGQNTDRQLVAGSVMLLVGAAAFLGELNPNLAATIFQCWPASLIGLGVVLLCREQRATR